MAKRVGAARRDAIPAGVLRELNEGTLESATLAEGLAIDFRTLLRAAAPDLPELFRERVRPTDGITVRMRTAGESLFAHFGSKGLSRFARHSSDTVRGWAAYAIAAEPNLAIAERLRRIRPLADDPHFAVREWAWCAVRDAITKDIRTAIQLLIPWVKNPSANLRRFAVESTRPRGVWCKHIDLLKNEPEQGMPLLEPLCSDNSKYVRDSVANWLNDAGKTQPAWVRGVCKRWELESLTDETLDIIRRATRNL